MEPDGFASSRAPLESARDTFPGSMPGSLGPRDDAAPDVAVVPFPRDTRPALRTGAVYVSSTEKRILDVVGAALLLTFFLPFIVILCLAVAATSAGPPIFVQVRSGLGQRPFGVLKIRSMYANSNDGSVRQAERGDSRCTPLGRVLRATSADELPQFVNVLRGEMSLVGPRPHALEHDEMYAGSVNGYERRFGARPGMTGLAQIQGMRGPTPNVAEMQKRIDADAEYLRTASLSVDLKILMRTLGHLAFYRDAY